VVKLSTHSGIWGHRGHWLATVGVVVGQLVFVALAVAFGGTLRNGLSAGGLEAVGIAVSLIPALIWLIFFYTQDQFEPEPKEYVLEVFILGLLVAGAAGIPLVSNVFQVDQWLYATPLTHLLGSILVMGFVQQFLIFAAVRYSIYESKTFDERVDGIIYATAAALGYATALNFVYVTSHGGVNLGVGTIRVTVDALAYASIGGVMGYMLGQAKFEHRPFYYLPAGLILVAVLDGVFFWLQDLVDVHGLSFDPLYGLILAVVIALVLLGVVLALVRRDNAETLALQGAPAGGE
jgi:RsiW-degrading membrane proteinase PrsW (M82 family)